MKEWRFKLNERTLLHDILEWREFGITFGREEKTSLIKSYTSQFTFIKEDAEWLKNIVYSQGCNAIVMVKIYSLDAFGNSTLEYEGQLNLSTFVDNGSTVSSGVYEGGFFNLLDNNWETEIEIRHDTDGMDLNPDAGVLTVGEGGEEVELPFNWQDIVGGTSVTYPTGLNTFEDIKFTGGEYLYNEELGLNDNAEYQVTCGYGIDNYLAIKKKGEGNDLLKFFTEAGQMAVINNAEQVTEKQCFINSPDKINGGYIELKGRNACTFIFPDIITNLDISGGFLNSIYRCHLMFKIKAFIFNEVLGDETWRPSQNLLSGTALVMEMNGNYPVRWKSYKDDSGNLNYKAIIENVHLSKDFENYFFLDGYLNQYKETGYKVGITLSDIEVHFFGDSIYARRYEGDGVQITIIPNSNFKILYKNPNFKLNVNRTVYGMRPSEVIHKILTKINNSKYTLNINLDELKQNREQNRDKT